MKKCPCLVKIKKVTSCFSGKNRAEICVCWQCSLCVLGILQYKQWSILKPSMCSWNQWSNWNDHTRRRSAGTRETAKQCRIDSWPSAAAETVSTKEATASAHTSWSFARQEGLLGAYVFLCKTNFFNLLSKVFSLLTVGWNNLILHCPVGMSHLKSALSVAKIGRVKCKNTLSKIR